MTKKKTTEEFIEQSIKKHGNKYNYSKVIYKNAFSKIIITCNIHGDFEQTPDSHLSGKGCHICGGSKKLTTEQFIEKSIKIHGDKYNYSFVKYINTNTKVIIICLIHDKFEQTPEKHLQGNGCPKCGIDNTAEKKRKSNEQFIIDANKIHGNKYNYSLVEYLNSHAKVIIICSIHDKFEQTPNSHIRGAGCPECSGNIKSTANEFIEKSIKIHGDKYDYKLVEYINTNSKVKIKCIIHGIFEQIPSNHLKGQGCIKCAGKNKKTTEEFIIDANKIHGDKYDYSIVNYIAAKIKIQIKCHKHGLFEQIPTNHLKGVGCPICINKTEGILYEYLQLLYPDTNHQSKFEWCRNPKTNSYLPYDFFIPSLNIIIELDGLQHFQQVSNWGDTYETQKRDKYKLQKALENNISVIRLLQDDVFNDKIDWKGKLKDALIKYETPHVVLLVEDESIYDYIFEKEDVIETLEELTETINFLRDELNKLPDLVIEKTITNLEDFEERFNDINEELTRLENVRENIYEDFIRSL
jgi:hypothetical protein